MAEKEKISIVFNQQRWDQVRLIKGFTNKEEAEKLRKSLEVKEDQYDEIYCIEDIELENSNENQMKINKEELLMIASFHSFQAREDTIKERLRFRKVSDIINKYIDIEELYKFQDNREDQFLKEGSELDKLKEKELVKKIRTSKNIQFLFNYSELILNLLMDVIEEKEISEKRIEEFYTLLALAEGD